MNFRYMCFIFFKQRVSVALEETFKGCFVCGGCFFFEKGKRVALAKLAFVAEKSFLF